ncbi:hypothetical protein E4T56_gene1020 [Termitomyces sp. T112]|nr:hypothetical protein E4T56_gene1020 [Termitomyces sp. T112]
MTKYQRFLKLWKGGHTTNYGSKDLSRLESWEEEQVADLEEDFNGSGLQNDIPSDDGLEYVDPVQDQPAEQSDPTLDNPLGPQDDIPPEPPNDDLEYVDPAGHQPAEQLDPLLNDPLGPQDAIPSDDDLEHVDPVEHEPAEDLDPATVLEMPEAWAPCTAQPPGPGGTLPFYSRAGGTPPAAAGHKGCHQSSIAG